MLPFNVWAQSLWETLYMVIVSTVISYAIGLPLGLTLVVTDKGGIRPMPLVNTVLGVVVNILLCPVPDSCRYDYADYACDRRQGHRHHCDDRSADLCGSTVCSPHG